MMSAPEKPLLVVLGATGNQGGSVITHFLSQTPQPYSLRAMTRDLSSVKAVSLISQGVEVVAGDFNDPQSLDAAFHGASVIFSVTDFLSLMLNTSMHEQAATLGISPGIYIRDYEAKQNKNIIDAAAKIPTLQRFIYSGLPNTTEISGGKYTHVYFYDSKAVAEEYGSATYPELWAKTSVLYAGFYLENLIGKERDILLPRLNEAKDTLVASNAEPLTTLVLPWYSVVNDTGPLVNLLLHAAPGKTLNGVSEWLSVQDFSKLLAQTLGKSIEFVDTIKSSFERGDPDLQRAREEMFAFCLEFGYDGGKKGIAIQPSELGVQLPPVKEWIERQDWEKILPKEYEVS